MEPSKLGKTLGTIGVVSGILYSMKKGEKASMTAFYAVGLGIAGILLGNAITNFYE